MAPPTAANVIETPVMDALTPILLLVIENDVALAVTLAKVAF